MAGKHNTLITIIDGPGHRLRTARGETGQWKAGTARVRKYFGPTAIGAASLSLFAPASYPPLSPGRGATVHLDGAPASQPPQIVCAHLQ